MFMSRMRVGEEGGYSINQNSGFHRIEYVVRIITSPPKNPKIGLPGHPVVNPLADEVLTLW